MLWPHSSDFARMIGNTSSVCWRRTVFSASGLWHRGWGMEIMREPVTAAEQLELPFELGTSV